MPGFSLCLSFRSQSRTSRCKNKNCRSNNPRWLVKYHPFLSPPLRDLPLADDEKENPKINSPFFHLLLKPQSVPCCGASLLPHLPYSSVFKKAS